jgi:RNA polymerase sigma-70 factor, ECF subfamily
MAAGVRWRHIATSTNGQLAVGCYLWDERQGHYRADALDVLTLRGNRIAAVTAFLGTGYFRDLGLPAWLPS